VDEPDLPDAVETHHYRRQEIVHSKGHIILHLHGDKPECICPDQRMVFFGEHVGDLFIQGP
jgi:hypothetical protein